MTEPDPSEIAARRIDRWKLSLLDLTLRNRLLDARDSGTLVPLATGDPAALAAALAGAASPRSPGQAGQEDVELTLTPYAMPAIGDERAAEAAARAAIDALAGKKLLTPLAPAELERRLVALARAARESLEEGGTHTLWLGLGFLHWREADAEPGSDGDAAPRRAPLVLVPVELRRRAGRYRLAATDDEPRINQTLIEKLRADFDVSVALPTSADAGAGPDDDEVDVAAVISAVAAAIADRPALAGWRVEPGACVGIFSFAKFVMWTDLEARAAQLLDAPVVRHLAGHRGEAFPDGEAALPAPSVVDATPIAELLTPLDCDASQMTAVLAAEQGRSFVLQGPPGTGKSQTITNLIAQCLARGKTVLFVSEKMAALEVVQRRLAAVGLGDFCLELHSHKAKKRPVIEALGRVLERAWRPGADVGSDARLEAARAQVNGYVDALHAATPLGMTVHQALGRLVELRDAPSVPAEIPDTAAGLGERTQALSRWAEAADRVAPLGEHPWRESELAAWQLSTADAVAAVVIEAHAAAGELEAEIIAWQALVPGLDVGGAAQLDAAAALWSVAARTPRPGVELVTRAASSGSGSGDDAVAARVAMVKARAERPPGDVPAWLALARRRRDLRARLAARWTDALDGLDLAALAPRFRRWAGRFLVWRWLALRAARAQLRRAAVGGPLPDDATIADDLDAALDEQRVRRALDEAREPARRWLGALAGAAPADPSSADLGAVDAALAWAGELRAAFDAAMPGPGPGRAEPPARQAAWRALVAAVAAPDGDAAPFTRAAAAAERWKTALSRLHEVAGIEPARLGAEPLAAVRAAAPRWKAAVPALRDWTAYVRARRVAVDLGLEPAIAAAESGALAPSAVPAAWERAALFAFASARLNAEPALRDFHGATHHARIAEFADLDRGQLAVARARIIARLAERVPRVSSDASGEVGALLHEVKKQRRHRPLRALFRDIPSLLPRLTPCLLMSPLSVAQYLDPALPRFDLVVFDEASQIPTADAIGALARGDAAVVVGDSRQLPPTRFFNADRSAAGGTDRAPAGDGDDDDDALLEELESVLDACTAARLPELRLGWHYRSRHEDLIAFSNHRYYDDRLEVFPAAAARVPDLGVEWRKIDGVYDRAGSRTNRAEAVAVVEEVVRRLRDPALRRHSIGVVTFSRPQQGLIEDLLDAEREADPSLDGFFAPTGGDAAGGDVEPVLIKNLETIQGDERDVMLFSIGYGPDAGGKVSMNFGPLNRDGGERRLNVAITRAREKLLVFSTLEPEQIDAEARALGVRHLAAFLGYVRGGGGAARSAEAAPAAPIIAALARALAEHGLTVHHQVGCAAYRIDLAVVDPDDPGRYVLGIEHDGASYAIAASARDRDRLRAQILGNLGWRLHRIWSLDFWYEPEREIERAYKAAITAIAAARAARKAPSATRSGPVRSSASGPVPTPMSNPGSASGRAARGSAPVPTSGAPSRPVPSPTSVPGPGPGPGPSPRPSPRPTPTPALSGGGPAVARGGNLSLFPAIPTPVPAPPPIAPAIRPYTPAPIATGERSADDLHDPEHAAEATTLVDKILAAEAPIHIDLLSRRVGAYFGITRMTSRVSDRVRELLDGRATFGAADDADVVWRADQDPALLPTVRTSDDDSEARRDVEEIPAVEIAAAAAVVLSRAVGAPLDDLARDCARLLGFARVTDRVARRMRTGIDLLAARGGCVIDGDRASLP